MPRGGKRPCKKCGEGHGNYPGGLCATCVAAAGGEVREPPRPADLTDDPDETDLQAMEALWLQQGKAKTVRQRAWVPLYKESAKSFRDRMDRMGGKASDPSPASTDASPAPSISWDRVGPCPTCQRTWDRITNDLSHERVVELLGEEQAERGLM